MSNPVILYGTAEDGSTLPVKVDATGRLVAQGLPGPEGPEGPPGVGELPPDPQEGQVLGWENGELVWMDQGGGFFFELDYLLVAGGGDWAYDNRYAYAGGGGGGVITSITGEMSGGGVAGAGPLKMPLDINGQLFSAVVGDVGQDTTLLIPGLSLTAKAGGDGGGNPGGSGGGGFQDYTRYAVNPGGGGYPGQGFAGGDGISGNNENCWTDPDKYRCKNSVCDVPIRNGAGGGAGGPGNAAEAGPGVQSTITGEALFYGAGGAGQSYCTSQGGATPAGVENYGTGRGWNYPRQPGVLYLRYPTWVLLEARGGSGTVETTEVDGFRVSKITGGYVPLLFKLQPGVVMSALIDKLKSHAN